MLPRRSDYQPANEWQSPYLKSARVTNAAGTRLESEVGPVRSKRRAHRWTPYRQYLRSPDPTHRGTIQDGSVKIPFYELARLVALAKSFFERFLYSHELQSLQRAIDAQHRAVELIADCHSHKLLLLDDLGFLLWTRFRCLGHMDDIERALAVRGRTVDLTPEKHDYPTQLISFASYLWLRYEQIEETIVLEDTATETTGEDLHRLRQLSSLASSLSSRFDRLGDICDLEKAITAQRLVIDLTPEGHPDRPGRLSNFAVSLGFRFQRLGKIRDLEDSIAKHKQVVDLTPDDHPDRPRQLTNLALSLAARFDRLGEVSDLEDAIAVDQLASDLTSEGDPEQPLRLNNLAWHTYVRFQHLGRLQDLELAISTLQSAVRLLPVDHPDIPLYLDSAAVLLRTRFEHLANIDDLQRAVNAHRLSIYITPDGHAAKPLRLHNLAVSLRVCFEKLGIDHNLDDAIVIHQHVLRLTLEGDPQEVERRFELGLSLKARFELRQSKMHFNSAFVQFMRAAMHSLGNPTLRLKSAQQCVSLLSRYPDFGSAELLLSAHSRIIEILPELVWMGYSIDRRFKESAKLGVLVNAAVSAFVSSRFRYQAIEWLEMGRSLIWSQIYSLREPLDGLELQHPQLAADLQKVTSELQDLSRAAQSRPFNAKVQLADEESHGSCSQSYSPITERNVGEHSAADRHRSLVIRYDDILKNVRKQPGFETFLRPPSLAKLFPSIEHLDGPVVFVNVHLTSCDALVLLPNGGIKHVALVDLQRSHLENLRVAWTKFLRLSNVRTRGSISVEKLRVQGRSSTIVSVLKDLWNWIVCPVIRSLGFIGKNPPKRLPHVTWCPTGPLTQLPLHAAGIYDADHSRVFDFVVSSYTPSLSALLRCRKSLIAQRPEPNILVVAQPATPGHAPLPHARHECEGISRVLHNSTPTILMDNQASVEHTLASMHDNAWVHLACHGFQDAKDPTRSAFALYDGSLTLSDLMSTTTKDAELAFLSACQTAVGDETIPEESAHLAAGMLAAGFKGVVATMWSILDQDAPILVQAYYERLIELRKLGSARTEGYTEAAYALHEAVKVLRDHVGEQNFVRWAPFVHFGV